MDEREIVERCRKGDQTAFRELYDTLSPQLISICRRYLGNTRDAEDVFQEGFVKIVNGIGGFSYRGSGSLSAWAAKVMINSALSQLRNKEMSVSLESVMEVAEPTREEVRTVPAEKLRQFVSELPANARAVVNLCLFENLSHREVAERLGIKEKSSSSQLAKARKVLAAKIKEYLKNNDTDQ